MSSRHDDDKKANGLGRTPGHGLTSPLILCASEGSGVTALARLLDYHPEIAFLREFELPFELMPAEGGFANELDLHEHLRLHPPRAFTFEVDKRLDFASLVRAMLEQKRTRDHKPRVGAAVRRHFDRVLRLWPDASFIKLHRDGRDVARAAIASDREANVYTGVQGWIDAERLWDEVKTRVPEARRIELRWEDLARSPADELRRLTAWIGVEYTDEMLRRGEAVLGGGSSWPLELSPRQIQIVEARAHDLLAARGYALSPHPRITLSKAETAVFETRARLSATKRRLTALGPRLWLESVVASKVAPQRWADDVELRVHQSLHSDLD